MNNHDSDEDTIEKSLFEMETDYDNIPASFRVVKKSEVLLSCKVGLLDVSPHLESQFHIKENDEDDNQKKKKPNEEEGGKDIVQENPFILYVKRSSQHQRKYDNVVDEEEPTSFNKKKIPFRLLIKKKGDDSILFNQNFSDFFKIKIRGELSIRFVYKEPNLNLSGFTVRFQYQYDFNLVKRMMGLRKLLNNKNNINNSPSTPKTPKTPRKNRLLSSNSKMIPITNLEAELELNKEEKEEEEEGEEEEEEQTEQQQTTTTTPFDQIDPRSERVVPVRTDLIRNYTKKKKSTRLEKETGGKKKQNRVFLGIMSESESTEDVLNSSFDRTVTPVECGKPKKCSSWDHEFLFRWFSQIPVFDRKKEIIISFYTYLENTNLLERFQELSKFCSNPFNNFMDLILKPEGEEKSESEEEGVQNSPKVHPKEVVKNVNEDGEEELFIENEQYMEELRREFDSIIESTSEDEEISKTIFSRLETHFSILKFMNYEYNPSFYVVLKKRLITILSSASGMKVCVNRKAVTIKSDPNAFLKYLEERILINFHSSWSVKALEMKIAFNILFGLTIKEYITRLEKRYKDYSEIQVPELSNLDSLASFSENVIGFPLEDISINVCLHKKLWTIEDRDLDAAKKESVKIKEELEKEKERIKQKYSNIISQIQNEENEKLMETKMKNEMQKLEKAMKKKRREVSKRIKELKNKSKVIRYDMSQAILKMSFDFYSFFEASTNMYYRRLNQIIDKKVKELLEIGKKPSPLKLSPLKNSRRKKKKNYGTISISTKLVISRRTDRELKPIHNFFLKLYKGLSLYQDLEHIKLGFSHSGIIFCNMLCQWFHNEVVVCEDIRGSTKFSTKYEDIACVDSQSLEFVTSKQFFEFVTGLSTFIIDVNTNWVYSAIGIRSLQKKYVMNCQEFSFRLLDTIGLDPNSFHPEINQFIDELMDLTHEKKKTKFRVKKKNFLSKKKKKNKKKNEENEGAYEEKEERCFRYFRIPKEFSEELKTHIFATKTTTESEDETNHISSCPQKNRKRTRRRRKRKRKRTPNKKISFSSGITKI